MNDPALNCLKPYLSHMKEATLFFADESALHFFDNILPNPLLTIVTNRFDVFQRLQQKKHCAIFSDFNPNEYSLKHPIKHIVYRISKEKSLVHHLLNQSHHFVKKDGQLIISGLKNEGIKNYSDKIIKQLKGHGNLKKLGNTYLGKYQFTDKKPVMLDDQNYANIQTININNTRFYSKPGVFGWNKIDQGTKLLLNCFDNLISKPEQNPLSVLDLGCGYGFIGLSIDNLGFQDITATDNNAAAIIAAKKNAQLMRTPMQVIPSNCAKNIDKYFDIVLCNPPFHRGFEHHQDLTELFLTQAKKHLTPDGFCLFVVNRFINLEQIANTQFNRIQRLDQNKSFSVYKLSNNSIESNV